MNGVEKKINRSKKVRLLDVQFGGVKIYLGFLKNSSSELVKTLVFMIRRKASKKSLFLTMWTAD